MATKERTTKQVVDETRDHLKNLVEAHIALAKAEMKDAQAQLVSAVVPLVGAGAIALFLLGFFGVTAAKALDLVVAEWLAWLIVSLVLTLLVVVLGLVGRSRLQAMNPSPDQTKASVQETVTWAKQRVGTVGE